MDNNPHKVPDGFFEKQHSEILNSISKNNKSYSKIFEIYKPTLAVAASLAGILLITLFIQEIKPEDCKSFACLLDSTDLNELSDTENSTLKEWEEEILDNYDF